MESEIAKTNEDIRHNKNWWKVGCLVLGLWVVGQTIGNYELARALVQSRRETLDIQPKAEQLSNEVGEVIDIENQGATQKVLLGSVILNPYVNDAQITMYLMPKNKKQRVTRLVCYNSYADTTRGIVPAPNVACSKHPVIWGLDQAPQQQTDAQLQPTDVNRPLAAARLL